MAHTQPMPKFVDNYRPELLVSYRAPWVNQGVVRFRCVATQDQGLAVERPVTNNHISRSIHDPPVDIQVLQVRDRHSNQEALMRCKIRANSNGYVSSWTHEFPWCHCDGVC